MLNANINLHNYCNNNIFFIKKTLNSLKLVKFKFNWLKYSIFFIIQTPMQSCKCCRENVYIFVSMNIYRTNTTSVSQSAN